MGWMRRAGARGGVRATKVASFPQRSVLSLPPPTIIYPPMSSFATTHSNEAFATTCEQCQVRGIPCEAQEYGQACQACRAAHRTCSLGRRREWIP